MPGGEEIAAVTGLWEQLARLPATAGNYFELCFAGAGSLNSAQTRALESLANAQVRVTHAWNAYSRAVADFTARADANLGVDPAELASADVYISGVVGPAGGTAATVARAVAFTAASLGLAGVLVSYQEHAEPIASAAAATSRNVLWILLLLLGVYAWRKS